ncbi:MAG: hypothetical protein EB127_24625, partial [Alphaproteobacteria bacterium]|nr:hypothetical protein [Alphaproteobacteria bacterium]
SEMCIRDRPKAANRFKNIVRIEFVKAIIPIEVTDIVVRKLGSVHTPDLMQALVNAQAIAITSINAGVSVAPTPAANLSAYNLQLTKDINTLLTPGTLKYDTTYLKSIYSYPFITLNISELDTNTYGTSSSMDNAFGILQYDSNWTDNTDSLGFTSLIPKHMKCQRIYSPTPLATLNKMTIRLQQPSGSLLNANSDTIDISGIFLSKTTSIRSYFTNEMDLSGTVYSDTVGEYIWLDCKKWFSRYQFAIGDKIHIKNLSSIQPTLAINDLMSFLQNSDGLTIAGFAWAREITVEEKARDISDPSYSLTNGLKNTIAEYVLIDGLNDAGYSRFIIVRGQFNDPTTGSTRVKPYGGAVDNTAVSTAMLSGSSKIIPGKLINLSRQTQLIFRVITREYDSTSLIRPDNL